MLLRAGLPVDDRTDRQPLEGVSDLQPASRHLNVLAEQALQDEARALITWAARGRENDGGSCEWSTRHFGRTTAPARGTVELRAFSLHSLALYGDGAADSALWLAGQIDDLALNHPKWPEMVP